MGDFLIKKLIVIAIDYDGLEHEFIPNKEDAEQFQEELSEFMEGKDAMYTTDTEKPC